jgi:hypothetical protein
MLLFDNLILTSFYKKETAMKKLMISIALLSLFILLISPQVSALCVIQWWGDRNGSVPTNENSKTPEARHEAFQAIFNQSNYQSGPYCAQWFDETTCVWFIPEGCDGYFSWIPPSHPEIHMLACDSGEWNHYYRPPSHYDPTITESGFWDVVCDNTTTTTVTPTVIKLSSFTATPRAGEVVLQWSTESETDNAGFNIYRADAEKAQYTKINAPLIPAKGSATQGTSYEFTDNSVQNRKTYYYKLEDIDLNGSSTMHGPVSATPRLIYGLN